MCSSFKEGDIAQCYYIKRTVIMKHFWMFHQDLLYSKKFSDTNASSDRNETFLETYKIMHLVY